MSGSGYCGVGKVLVNAHREAEREKSRFLAEQRAEKCKDAIRAFEGMMGVMLPEDFCTSVIEHEPAVVTAGDLRIASLYIEGADYFRLWGKCPWCGRHTWSKDCYNAATLGGQVVSFEPGYDHVRECPVRNKKEPLPWRERLRLAWRILREGR